jgi:hypothetical protein
MVMTVAVAMIVVMVVIVVMVMIMIMTVVSSSTTPIISGAAPTAILSQPLVLCRCHRDL